MQITNSVTVLTTAERADYFRLACGEGAHYCIDPRRTIPLADFLANLAVAGGGTVVLDEDHFVNARDLRNGLRTFLNSGTRHVERLRVVVVCSRRNPPDELLFFVAAYCGIYDVAYNVEDVQIGLALSEVLRTPRTRLDVLDLLELPQKGAEAAPVASAGAFCLPAEERFAVDIRIRVTPTCVEVGSGEAASA